MVRRHVSRYNAPMEGLSFSSFIFVCLALGGASWGLLQFGIGAMLWADQKIFIAIGLVSALCGLYLGLLAVFLIVSPYLG
jgi:hypothetical protein